MEKESCAVISMCFFIVVVQSGFKACGKYPSGTGMETKVFDLASHPAAGNVGQRMQCARLLEASRLPDREARLLS